MRGSGPKLRWAAPREELPAGAPHDDVLAEHPSRNRSTVCKLCGTRYVVPIIYEDRVIDQRYSAREWARCDDATPPMLRPPTGPEWPYLRSLSSRSRRNTPEI